MRWLTSRAAALISGGIILLIGMSGWAMDGQREAIYRALAAAYLVMATYWAIDITPLWLSQIRSVVMVSDAEFEALAGRVIGARLNPFLKLLAPLFCAVWVVGFIINWRAGSSTVNWLTALTEPLMPIIEVFMSLVITWRMWHLSVMARKPLAINLFNTRDIHPFGFISLAHAAVISIRVMIRLVFSGSVQGDIMTAVFALGSLASFLALALPIWPIHSQMVRAKIKLLNMLDARMHKATAPLFDADESDPVDLSPLANSVGTIGGLRDRIGKTWTWPLPNSITAVQALALSTAPALINVIKNYLAPFIKLISGS